MRAAACFVACLSLVACPESRPAAAVQSSGFDAGPGPDVTRAFNADAGVWIEEETQDGVVRRVTQRASEGPRRLTEDLNGDGRWDATEERTYADGREVFRERREDQDFDGTFDLRRLWELTPEGQQRRVRYELLSVDGGAAVWKPTSEVIGAPEWP